MIRFPFPVFLLFQLSAFGQNKENIETIPVPVDYSDPKAGTTTVSYELGAVFSPTKPTVFIITDAQQFYVRKGAVSTLQATLLDTSYNVVGILNRSNNDDLKNFVIDKSGNIDWRKAATVFSWQQYVNDINEVRKKLVGDSGHIYLYGQSGGGFLIHQFLSVYGQYVDKAFTAAAVNYSLDAEAGINHDKFWEQATRANPQFAEKFKELIAGNLTGRDLIAMLFQRQHFFVQPDSLDAERNRLLNTLLANDTTAIRQYQQDYQVTAIRNFYTSPDGIPVRVRLFEFIFPLLKDFHLKADTLQPDLENLYYSSLPLIKAFKDQKNQPATMQFLSQHVLKTKVFILAGRWDHTADYRSQIALASTYPEHVLLIANDNHTFNALKNDGQYRKLILSFFRSESTTGMQTVIKREFWQYCWKE